MKNILVVEDSPTIQQVVRTFLEDEGYSVQMCSKMEDAVAILNSTKIDLVLSDVIIESKDAKTGYHILKHIKNTPDIKNIPVIIMTDRRGSDTAEGTARRLGASAFLKKPFKITELRQLLTSLMSPVD
jgi:CheY-like chemotaxis protein